MYEPENFKIEEDNHEDLFSPITKCHCFILQVMLHQFREGGDQNNNNNNQKNKAFAIMFKLIIKLLGCQIPHNVPTYLSSECEWMTEFLTKNGRQDFILSKSELINLEISASMVWRVMFDISKIYKTSESKEAKLCIKYMSKLLMNSKDRALLKFHFGFHDETTSSVMTLARKYIDKLQSVLQVPKGEIRQHVFSALLRHYKLPQPQKSRALSDTEFEQKLIRLVYRGTNIEEYFQSRLNKKCRIKISDGKNLQESVVHFHNNTGNSLDEIVATNMKMKQHHFNPFSSRKSLLATLVASRLGYDKSPEQILQSQEFNDFF